MPGHDSSKKLCCPKHESQKIKKEKDMELEQKEQKLLNERALIIEGEKKLSCKAREYRMTYRVMIENRRPIWTTSGNSEQYVIVNKAPALAIARIRREASRVKGPNGEDTLLQCELFGRKPLDLDRSSSDSSSKFFIFVLEFQEFPVNKLDVLEFIDPKELKVLKDENNHIRELRFSRDPFQIKVKTGVY